MDQLLSSFNLYGTLTVSTLTAKETGSERTSILGKSPIVRRMLPAVETWSTFL